MTPEYRRKEAEVKEIARFPSPQMKPKNSNERQDNQTPAKAFNIIDIFLNNAKKMEPSSEKTSNYPKTYDNSPKNSNYAQIPGNHSGKSRYSNHFDPFSNSEKTPEERSHHYQEEKPNNYSAKSPFHGEKPHRRDEKSHHHYENSGHFGEKSHNLDQKPQRHEVKIRQTPTTYTEKSRVGYWDPPKLDFQPILPENIENDTNYLYFRHPDSSKLKESRKDFSVFGKYLTGNQPQVKKNVSHQSISPYLREEKSIQKSRSSRFFEKNEASPENQEGFSRKSARQTHRNETLHNASASVLSNMDLKSFASNRPEFINAGTRENTVC